MNTKSKILFMLPKYSSYEFRDSGSKYSIAEMIQREVDFFRSYDFNLLFVAEDRLALQLYGDVEDVEWISVVGSSDKNFIKNRELMPLYYYTIQAGSVSNEILSETSMKYKPGRIVDFASKEEYNKAREMILHNRIRLACHLLVDKCLGYVYIDARNNYSSFIAPSMGDGKLVRYVDLATGLVKNFYGGIPLDNENMNAVMGGLQSANV